MNGDLVVAGTAEHPADNRRNSAFRWRLFELRLRNELRQHGLRRHFTVAKRRVELVGFPNAVLGQHAAHRLRFGELFDIETVTFDLLVEQLPAKLDAPLLLLGVDEMLDLVPRSRGGDEIQPVAAWLVPRRRQDLDDVAVAQPGTERDHLSVDPGADALMSDVGMNRVGKIDRRRVTRQRFDFSSRREDVDLFGIQLDLQVLEELLRVANFLLPLEQLAQPDEVLLVAARTDATFLVFPVRGDAFFGRPVHVRGPDLDLERHAAIADHRGVQGLVAVRARHRDEVFDSARNWRPGLMNDAERTVAVLDRLGHDAQRDQIVDLIQLDLLPLQFLVNAEEPLDATVDLDDRNLRLGELRGNGVLQILDHPLGRAPPPLDLQPERFVGGRLEVLERQLFELVLDLAHPQPVGDRRVDVARLLRDLDAALLRQVVQRPHVVEPVGELHQDHADVVHHREQHLAEILRLTLLAR